MAYRILDYSFLWTSLSTLLLLLLATSGPLPFAFGHEQYADTAVSGVYVEEVPTPIFYDTFLPVILEYILPHWNKSDVTFNNWYNCTSEASPYKYTCPSVYHMNRAILNLHIDFLAIQPVSDSVPHTEYYDRLQGQRNFCNLIQRHFSGVYIQDNELTTYIRTLEKCNTGGLEDDIGLVFLERSLPDFNFSIRHPFTKMEANFYNIFYKQINGVNGSVMDLVASATLSNARATIQGTLLSAYYAEKYRWSHAVQDCNAQLIPHSLVSSQKFEDKLDEISKHQKFRQNFNFSIPMSLLSKYFSVPIADCTYTNETFVSRIQIPVKAKSITGNQSPTRFVTLISVPFVYKNKLCSVQIDNRQHYVYDVTKMVAYKTDCKMNELCFTQDTFSPRFIDLCATALLNHEFQQVINYCKFECVHQISANTAAGVDNQGIVTRVGTDKYVITGPGTKVLVKCQTIGSGPSPLQIPNLQSTSSTGPNSKEETHEFVVGSDGALELSLPCNCQLQVNGRGFYSAMASDGYGCGLELKISHITPWHLIKDKDMIGHDASPDDVILNFYTDEDKKRRDTPLPFNSAAASASAAAPSVPEQHSQLSLWIFFGLTSIILFLIQCYIIYLLRQPGNGNYPRHKLFFKAKDPEPQVGLLETPYENI